MALVNMATKGAPDYDTWIRKYGAQFGVPPELLRRMVRQESGGNINAVSPKGARGIAQFMPGTATKYKVDVNDPESSIRGMAQYMRDNYNKLGSWEKAAAGYNWGENREAFNSPGNEWLSAAPKETRDYIAAIKPGEFDEAYALPPPGSPWNPNTPPATVYPVAAVGEPPAAPTVPPPQQNPIDMGKALEVWKAQQDYLMQQEKPPGYGDMSHMRAGFAGLSNPGYTDVGGYAEPAIANLMQLLLSEGLGGQKEFINFMGLQI